MKREELFKNKGYNTSKIQHELFRELSAFMEKNNMNRTQLAKHLGVTKGYVSQVLNGDFDYKLSKLVELSLAMGKMPQITFVDFDQALQPEPKMAVVHQTAEFKFSNRSSEKPPKSGFEEYGSKTYKIS